MCNKPWTAECRMWQEGWEAVWNHYSPKNGITPRGQLCTVIVGCQTCRFHIAALKKFFSEHFIFLLPATVVILLFLHRCPKICDGQNITPLVLRWGFTFHLTHDSTVIFSNKAVLIRFNSTDVGIYAIRDPHFGITLCLDFIPCPTFQIKFYFKYQTMDQAQRLNDSKCNMLSIMRLLYKLYDLPCLDILSILV
jgi:hypothetical protein